MPREFFQSPERELARIINKLTYEEIGAILALKENFNNQMIGIPLTEFTRDGQAVEGFQYEHYKDAIHSLIEKKIISKGETIHEDEMKEWFTLTQLGEEVAKRIDDSILDNTNQANEEEDLSEMIEIEDLFNDLEEEDFECISAVEPSSESLGFAIYTEDGNETEEYTKHKVVIEKLIKLNLIKKAISNDGREFIILTEFGNKLLKYIDDLEKIGDS